MQFYDLDSNNSRAKLDEILPHLYLSNRYGAWNLKLLQKKNITHILVVGEELSSYFTDHFIYEQLLLHFVIQLIMCWFTVHRECLVQLLSSLPISVAQNNIQ
jgi:hypothetical protein